MCMTLGFCARGVGLVAADTRYGFSQPHGTLDLGFRVRRVTRGWVGATGNIAVILLALREVERLGLENLDGMRHMLPAVHTWAVSRSRTGKLGDSMLIAVREGDEGCSIHGVLASDGLTIDRPLTSTQPGIIAWPVGIDTEHAVRINSQWFRRFARSSDVAELVRQVAHAFEYGRANGRNMSDEVEIGLSVNIGGVQTPHHLRKPTAWVIAASQSEILSALQAPTPLPPFPTIQPERITFRTAGVAV